MYKPELQRLFLEAATAGGTGVKGDEEETEAVSVTFAAATRVPVMDGILEEGVLAYCDLQDLWLAAGDGAQLEFDAFCAWFAQVLEAHEERLDAEVVAQSPLSEEDRAREVRATRLFQGRCDSDGYLSFQGLSKVSEISEIIEDGELAMEELEGYWAKLDKTIDGRIDCDTFGDLMAVIDELFEYEDEEHDDDDEEEEAEEAQTLEAFADLDTRAALEQQLEADLLLSDAATAGAQDADFLLSDAPAGQLEATAKGPPMEDIGTDMLQDFAGLKEEELATRLVAPVLVTPEAREAVQAARASGEWQLSLEEGRVEREDQRLAVPRQFVSGLRNPLRDLVEGGTWQLSRVREGSESLRPDFVDFAAREIVDKWAGNNSQDGLGEEGLVYCTLGTGFLYSDWELLERLVRVEGMRISQVWVLYASPQESDLQRIRRGLAALAGWLKDAGTPVYGFSDVKQFSDWLAAVPFDRRAHVMVRCDECTVVPTDLAKWQEEAGREGALELTLTWDADIATRAVSMFEMSKLEAKRVEAWRESEGVWEDNTAWQRLFSS